MPSSSSLASSSFYSNVSIVSAFLQACLWWLMLLNPMHIEHSLRYCADVLNFQKLHLQHPLEVFVFEHVYVLFVFQVGSEWSITSFRYKYLA